MNDSLIDIISLELLQNSTTNVEASLVSPSIAKPNVGGSFCPQDTTTKNIK